jgi:hypothetical protein
MGYSGPADNLAIFSQAGTDGELDMNQWGYPAQNHPPYEASPRLKILMTASQSGLPRGRMDPAYRAVLIKIHLITNLNISTQTNAVITSTYYRLYRYIMIQLTAKCW